MEGCPFCDGAGESETHLHSGELTFSVLDRYPACPGHSLVITRRHVASFFQLTEQEWAGLREGIDGTVRALAGTDLQGAYEAMVARPLSEKSARFARDALSHPGLCDPPAGYNIGLNEGRAAGRTIDHLHIHIIPRFPGDVEDHMGGIRHIIAGKGNYTAGCISDDKRGGGDGQ